MKFTGKITGLSKDMVTEKVQMTIEVFPQDNFIDGFNRLKDKDYLEIEIEKPKQPKSRNANAYFHALVGEIAGKLRISRQKCKNMLICRYGQPFLLPDGSPFLYATNAPVEYMEERGDLHTVAVDHDDNGMTLYEVYRGVSTYNDEEMSKLLDGTVSEAIDQGLETVDGERLAEYRARKAEREAADDHRKKKDNDPATAGLPKR